MTAFNFKIHEEIKQNLVEHPEWLPKVEMAKYTSIWFQNVRADWYRLETIQYIGGNAVGAEYKKYLFKVLQLVTGLNPYFQHPYVIGELLLPDYNERYENLPESEQERNLDESIELGKMGIQNFCDAKKVEELKTEFNLVKIWTTPYYETTCKSYEIPFYLAYIYYFYKHDALTAAWYYRVASSNKDAPEGSKIMTAIMQGKWGDREKSILMFLNLAKNFDKDDEDCQWFVNGMEQLTLWVTQQKVTLNKQIMQEVQTKRAEFIGWFNEKEELKIFDATCKNYVNKAVRELNLMYIEAGDKKYQQTHDIDTKRTAKDLFKMGYIDFLPIDYQQYKGKDYGIIYEYNPDLKRFDYDMGTYQ